MRNLGFELRQYSRKITSACATSALFFAVFANALECGNTAHRQLVREYDGSLGPSVSDVFHRSNAVGALFTYGGGAECSGTLISHDLFLTAAHCPLHDAISVAISFLSPVEASHYTIAEIVERGTESGYDYAILRLNGNPGSVHGFARLAAAADPPAGAPLMMIGHPGGASQMLDVGIANGSSPVQFRFRHSMPFTSAQSGSGVLDADGRLVGVATQFGCQGDLSDTENQAVSMTSIYSASPTIRTLYTLQLWGLM